jgi:cyclopropane fatty-acyl-phospholipid synthase-like methyltransferase
VLFVGPLIDRAKFSAIAFTDHDVCSPIDGRRLDEVLALCALPPGARVLDLGCG